MEAQVKHKVPTGRPRGPARRAWFIGGLAAALLLVLAGAYVGLNLARKPDPAAVASSFTTYIEGLAVSGKIVLVEARERISIHQTTPGFLFGDTSFGRFLGIRSDATIEASAWADIAYIIDLHGSQTWSVRYDPARGGLLTVAAPPIAMLTPSILTETIEIKTVERSLFLDETRLKDSVLRSMTTRFVEAASRGIDEPLLREKAAAAIEAMARKFADNFKFKVERVEVNFAPAEG